MLFLEKTPQLSDTDINIYQYIVTHLESVQYIFTLKTNIV